MGARSSSTVEAQLNEILSKVGQLDAINQWISKMDLHIISITSSLGSFMTKFAELGQNLGALAGRGLYAVSLH